MTRVEQLACLDPALNPYRSALDALLLWLGAPLAAPNAPSEKTPSGESGSDLGPQSSGFIGGSEVRFRTSDKSVP